MQIAPVARNYLHVPPSFDFFIFNKFIFVLEKKNFTIFSIENGEKCAELLGLQFDPGYYGNIFADCRCAIIVDKFTDVLDEVDEIT